MPQTKHTTPISSFFTIPQTHPFPIQNLPYGIFSTTNNTNKRIGIAIGDYILDLSQIESANLFQDCYNASENLFQQNSLLSLMQQTKATQQKIRQRVQQLLSADNPELRDNQILRQAALIPQSQTTMHLPGVIHDYTDFFSSIDHAINTGSMFRDKDNALLPNYRHLPVAYHGRASSIITSGHAIKRPHGQVMPKEATTPIFPPHAH
jgi:Domain of unknown function (DUF1969).